MAPASSRAMRRNTRAAIAGLRDRLLGEHLGCSSDDVAAAIAREGSLVRAIETLRGGPPTLKPLDRTAPELLDRLVPETRWLDPERPIAPEELVARLLPAFHHDEAGDPIADERASTGSSDQAPPLRTGRTSRTRALLRLDLALAVLTALFLLWSLTPEVDAASVGFLVRPIDLTGVLTVTLAVAFAGFVFASPALLTIAAGAVLGPVLGGLAALGGLLVSASLSFQLGARLGRRIVRVLSRRHLNRISRRLGRHGILRIALLRLAPIAPFALVGLVAGASRVALRDFLAGTALGLLPGTATLALLGDRLVLAWRDPTLWNIGAVLASLTVALLVMHITDVWASWRRRLQRESGQIDRMRSRERRAAVSATWTAP